jgi:hypothetical protein
VQKLKQVTRKQDFTTFKNFFSFLGLNFSPARKWDKDKLFYDTVKMQKAPSSESDFKFIFFVNILHSGVLYKIELKFNK